MGNSKPNKQRTTKSDSMKLSDLNRFKGKDVLVQYRNDKNEMLEIEGTLEHVEEDSITIGDETSLERIEIDSIEHLEITKT